MEVRRIADNIALWRWRGQKRREDTRRERREGEAGEGSESRGYKTGAEERRNRSGGEEKGRV